MMRRAGRVHGLRGLGLAILIALVSWGALEGYGSLQAAHLVDSLRTANIRDVPARIEQLRAYRRWAGRPLAAVAGEHRERPAINISGPAWPASPCGPATERRPAICTTACWGLRQPSSR